MAANEKASQKLSQGGLRFKEGPYLTPKVERIMLLIARGKSAKWIAELYDVREPFIHYVAKKTGFPSDAISNRKKSLRIESLEPAW